MDCAKGINFLLTNGGRIEDYWGANKARLPMLPMIAVPTTSGTGSEAQSYALIAHPKTHMKMACGDPKAACRLALLDPELTLSMPGSVTAATGIDALSHAVESHVCTRRNPSDSARRTCGPARPPDGIDALARASALRRGGDLRGRRRRAHHGNPEWCEA